MTDEERDKFEREMDAMAADPRVQAILDELYRSLRHLDGEALPPS